MITRFTIFSCRTYFLLRAGRGDLDVSAVHTSYHAGEAGDVSEAICLFDGIGWEPHELLFQCDDGLGDALHETADGGC